MSLDFSAMHLIVDNRSPTQEDLVKVFSDTTEENYSLEQRHYIINKKSASDNQFWLCFRYGKELPYTDTVINTANFSEEINPRSKEQVEPDKQLFAFYSLSNKALYISNTRQIGFLQTYLTEKFNKTVIIKSFYISPEEFLAKIKSVEKVKFVTKNNLFSMDGGLVSISPEHKDIFGLGVPEDYCIEANYKNTKLTESFKSNLKNMVDWKNRTEAHALVCIGHDDKNFETIFNGDSFRQKISVPIEKDEDGMYSDDAVFNLLRLSLKGK